jgi:hypothetical protein
MHYLEVNFLDRHCISGYILFWLLLKTNLHLQVQNSISQVNGRDKESCKTANKPPPKISRKTFPITVFSKGAHHPSASSPKLKSKVQLSYSENSGSGSSVRIEQTSNKPVLEEDGGRKMSSASSSVGNPGAGGAQKRSPVKASAGVSEKSNGCSPSQNGKKNMKMCFTL